MTQDHHAKTPVGQLDAAALLKAAKEKSGLSDFGDMGFYEPLCKLLECAARDVPFNAQGLTAFSSDIVRMLVNRLRMQDDIRRHPEILDEDVSDPFIITGLPRSGTTKLHKMLSTPANVQKTLFWRMWNPAPFPDAVPGKPDPRIAAAGTSHMLTADNPVADAGHHIEEGEVEEEGFIYIPTFDVWDWDQMFCMPSYFDWVVARPSIEPYRYGKRTLQYLQWQDGGKRGRPWVLKSVGYIANLDSLLKCYPNATIVSAHRSPHACIPSFAKFLSGVHSVYVDKVDTHALGAESQRTWRVAMERYLAARKELNLDERILDVEYDQIRTDPMSIVRKIYARSQYSLTPALEVEIESWHLQNEQGRYGKHDYSLEEFGLSEEGIDAAFANYIQRFIAR